MLDAFLDFRKRHSRGEAKRWTPRADAETAVEDAQRAGRNVTLLPPRVSGNRHCPSRRDANFGGQWNNLISNAVGGNGARAEVSVLLTDKTLRSGSR